MDIKATLGLLAALASPFSWGATPQGICLPFSTAPSYSCPQFKPDDPAYQMALALGWQIDPTINLCQGYYVEPVIAGEDHELQAENDTRISADNGSFLLSGGFSSVSGNVLLEQPHRTLSAEKVKFYKDPTSGKVSEVYLDDHVKIREQGKLLTGDHAYYQLLDNTGFLDHAFYRMSLRTEFNVNNNSTEVMGLTGRGSAERIDILSKDKFIVHNATYSHCPPLDKSWSLKSKEIDFDKTTGRATAYGSQLRFLDIPVIYAPWLNFPADDKRHSGLLTPEIYYNNNNGLDLGLPVYLNLADNYDATLIPRYIDKRGAMIGGEFRYLDEYSQLTLYAETLPDDKLYREQHPTSPKHHLDRGALRIQEHSDFTPELSADINYSTVSDDDYFVDFHRTLIDANNNQLLQEAGLTYQTDHWTWYLRGQQYQTLHPSAVAPISDVYAREPEVGVFVDYPEQWLHSHWMLRSNYNHFVWPDETSTTNPNGERAVFNPILELPLLTSYSFLTPRLSWQFRSYELTNGLVNHQDFNLPVVSVDSGLIFDRGLMINQQSYTQTFEPRVYYLYAPYREQDELPLFDTGLATFNYQQLFRDNRFIGDDRVNDANQVSLAVSSRLLRDLTGEELVQVGLGEIFYFQDRQVQLCTGINCTEPPQSVSYVSPTAKTSPTVAFLRYHLNKDWSLNIDASYDTQLSRMNTAYVNLHYQPMDNHIIDLSYSFVQQGDLLNLPTDQAMNDLSQLGIASAWPINDHWHLLGAARYNIERSLTQTYFAGAGYDDCCWGLRVLAGRTFTHLNDQNKAEYDTLFYVQFVLKGVTTLAPNNPTKLITAFIPGYHDNF